MVDAPLVARLTVRYELGDEVQDAFVDVEWRFHRGQGSLNGPRARFRVEDENVCRSFDGRQGLVDIVQFPFLARCKTCRLVLDMRGCMCAWREIVSVALGRDGTFRVTSAHFRLSFVCLLTPDTEASPTAIENHDGQ